MQNKIKTDKVAVISFLFFSIIIIILYKFHNEHLQLKAEIQQFCTHDGTCPTKEVVEKIVTKNDPWLAVQPKVKDTVVQVFAHVGEFNWLEPYKSPNQSEGRGSGFLINENGDIITNAHVVDQAKAVSIQIPSLGKEQFEVEILGVSFDRDIALLRLKKVEIESIKSVLGKIPYIKLGNSDHICRANEVMVLGYPLGQQSIKSTRGIVSGRESIMSRQLIQIDAAINPGNSGGPAINLNGEVIGIATANVPSAQNVGYIIPVNELKIARDDLYNAKNKLLRRPFLGIFYNSASAALTNYLKNPQPGGCYVTAVYQGSLLDQVGIKAKDMIYEINGQTVDIYGEISANWCEDKISLVDYVSFIPLNKEVNIVVYRSGEKKEFKFKFVQSKLPEIRVMYPDYEKIDYEVIGGLVVMQLARNHLPYLIQAAPELIKYEEPKNQIEPVLIVTHVLPDSQAQRSRVIAPGTRLKEVNSIEVKTLDEFRNAVKESLNTGYLTIKTASEIFTVFPFKRVLEDELRLPKIYRYPVSHLVEELMKKFIEKNENKKAPRPETPGAVA